VSVSQNFFQLFGLAEQFDIDLNQLSSTYRNIQRNTHPDRHAHASRRDQLLSMQYTANVNEAYETLSSPLKRASYLLKLKGVDLSEDNSTNMDPLFLMQQIELREELETARHAAAPESSLEQIGSKLREQLQDYETLFRQQMAEISPETSPELLDKAAEQVKKMQFIVKMQHEVERLEEELLDY